MTHSQALAALEEFRGQIASLSRQYPDDRDFWPAYADQANALEGSCPLDFRDYVRESILRTVQIVVRDRG
jgi:hypothetical protein